MSCSPYTCDGSVCATSCAQTSDCESGLPCNTCPAVAKLCLAPLGVGDGVSAPCHPSNTCGPIGTFAHVTGGQAIAFDGTHMWVANQGGVTEL